MKSRWDCQRKGFETTTGQCDSPDMLPDDFTLCRL
jgi:hypothetical protein